MRVVGVGFGRTGTSSLKLALERLGFGPCYHMFEIVGERSRAHDWLAAARGDLPDWDRVFAGYRSTVDWPGAAFWRELLEAYPQAVAILSVRDPGTWHDSVLRTIFRGDRRLHTPTAQKIMRLVTIAKPDTRALTEMLDAAVRDRVFDGRPTDREHAIGVFERHVADVTASVPADRLLVFEVKDGWVPLCAFLGVPVPDEPFPHVNDTAEFRRAQVRGMLVLTRPLLVTAGVATAAVIAARILRRRR